MIKILPFIGHKATATVAAAQKTAKPAMTEPDFQRLGNSVADQLEGVFPSLQHDQKETKVIDSLKELLFNSEGIKLQDENNKRFLFLLQHKAKVLEPETEQTPAVFLA